MPTYSLVATHLSSVFPSSNIPTHAIVTTRRDLPLATAQSDIPDNHASYSSLFNSIITGGILIRVIQGGLAIELISLTTAVSPIRFVFPAAVLPSPSLCICQNQLHLLVVTSVGSLYRIIFPSNETGQLWNEPFRHDWCKEWQIKKLSGVEPKLVHVQDSHTVAVALSSGGFLKLESNFDDDQAHDELWLEIEYRLNNWYSTLLPVLSHSHSPPTEIVSFAAIPPPTDVPDLFTLSRDRTLRRWSAKGFHSEYSGLDDAQGNEILLEARPQKLLYAFIRVEEGDEIYVDDRESTASVEKVVVVVFIPTPSSPTSAGLFHFFSPSNESKSWSPVGRIPASMNSVDCKLQDFLILKKDKAKEALYVLWERQGQSILEYVDASDTDNSSWTVAKFWPNNELSSEAIDELLLRPGSLSDKFMEMVFRPGVFSVLTLRTALQEYKAHYLSLSGPHPPPLLSSYATLRENIAAVIGCTVTLSQDTHTGAFLHDKYWNALRRDWEGFIARCKEFERSARWPLALGRDESSASPQVLIIERERMGKPVEDDYVLNLCRSLMASESGNEEGHNVISVCWTLGNGISKQLSREFEAEIMNILNQEYAFSLTEVIAEASNRIMGNDRSGRVLTVDGRVEDIEQWLSSHLGPINGYNTAFYTALDMVGALNSGVKREEDEVELIIPPVTTEWTQALVTSYIELTVEVRYEMCMKLLFLFFVVGDQVESYDSPVLTETFALFRGLVMLRFLCRQTAGDWDVTRPTIQEPQLVDDASFHPDGLFTSRETRNPVPTYSLVHELVSGVNVPYNVHEAAQYFLQHTNLLSSESIAFATQHEVWLCERLRVLGRRESCRQLLGWLPSTAAICYIQARLWIDMGLEDDAAAVLRNVAGNFGPEGSLSRLDNDAFSSVLPGHTIFPSECDYYLHTAELFKNTGSTKHEVSFTKLAISTWPEGQETTEFAVAAWATLIKGYTDLNLYEEAYDALINSPHQDQKTKYVPYLVYKMCENNALNRLLSMSFHGLNQEVELSLSFKARNANPCVLPNWSQILYTWYTVRGDYRNAALVMYIRSRKIAEMRTGLGSSSELVEQQLEALSVAINALNLVDHDSAYIVISSLVSNAPSSHRNYIPQEKFTSGSRNIEIVRLGEIEKEYVHLTAIVELHRRAPSVLQNGESMLSPWATVSKLAQFGLHDQAMYTAKALSVDMTELFQRLALQCLRLTANSETSSMEVAASDWLLTDQVSSWPGTSAERGWRYLRQCLERYDAIDINMTYHKAVLETLLSHDATHPLPQWLLQNIEEKHSEHLIRTYLKYGNLEEALDHTLQLVRKSTIGWGHSSSTHSSSTWLPYTLIDAVLKSAEDGISPRAKELREALHSEVSNRVARLQRHVKQTIQVEVLKIAGSALVIRSAN